MKRSLLLVFSTLLFFLFLAASPARADPQSFQVEGQDRVRGAFTGQLVLTEQPDGRVEAEAQLEFARSGERKVQSGMLRQVGDELMGTLRDDQGMSGALDPNQRRPPTSLLVVQVSPDQQSCRGHCLSAQGVGSFQGVAPDDTGSTPPDETAPLVGATGDSFAGRPIVDYDPATGITHPTRAAYRVRFEDSRGATPFDELMQQLLDDPNLEFVEALVIGNWGEYGDSPDEAVAALTNHADRLPNLKAIFVGDISQEEAEISWIQQGDLSPLLAAFPQLEELKVRGGMDLSLSGASGHANLRKLTIESGGLPSSVTAAIGSMDLPQLEELELWLGSEEYGWDGTAADVAGILAGAGLPNLKRLGLMDSEIQDEIAKAAATGAIVSRLEELDLSMGILTDEGGEALLASAAVAGLDRLNLRHHYMTDAVMARFASLGPAVDVSEQEDGSDPDDRYIEVSE
jgi:hypothetical protein